MCVVHGRRHVRRNVVHGRRHIRHTCLLTGRLWNAGQWLMRFQAWRLRHAKAWSWSQGEWELEAAGSEREASRWMGQRANEGIKPALQYLKSHGYRTYIITCDVPRTISVAARCATATSIVEAPSSLVTPGMACRHVTCDAVASRETRDRLPSHLRPYLASDALQRSLGRENTCMCE